MSSPDLSVGNDRTFKINFSNDGEAKLKKTVNEKLMALMDDYHDESLADYVMVLVRNGRCKDEVKKELVVFLGEESDLFVSWLWDHLSSNSHLYVKQKILFSDNLSKTNSQVNGKVKKHDSQPQQRSIMKKNDIEYEKQGFHKFFRSQHNGKFFSQSSLNECHLKDCTNQRVNLIGRPHSSSVSIHRKRRWLDDPGPIKSDTYSYQSVGPTSRLLQSALRDLLTASQKTTSRTEPALKRLRSLVSIPSTRVIDSAAEATENVWRVDHSEILGKQNHDINITDTINQSSTFEEDFLNEDELDDIFQITRPDYDVNMLNGEFETIDDNTMFTCGVKKIRVRDPEQHTIRSDVSQKIVNISVNVNTRKPLHDENSKKFVVEKGDVRRGKPNAQFSNNVISGSDNVAVVSDAPKKYQKPIPSTPGQCSATHVSDDSDSRIINVSNVHFAATKETLSHHFHIFGEVLKVFILSDTTTGQPKGSAIIEFLKKESAEQALSLNGTYFMSRVLKVVKGKTACHDNTKPIVPPRISRYSLSGPMLRRVAFPRGGFSNYLNSCIPVTRNLQWKREEGIKSVQKAPVPRRNFTYVRNTD